MSRRWRPIAVGALIVVATFVLAKAHVFEPSTATGVPAETGDVAAGEQVFQRECAACHGPNGEGGTGPTLAGSGLSAEEITTRVRQGAGVMPAGLVSGQEEADVVAYVASIAGP